ncbi:hypothetical protein ScPMuIL_003683 [Solemya velum]
MLAMDCSDTTHDHKNATHGSEIDWENRQKTAFTIFDLNVSMRAFILQGFLILAVTVISTSAVCTSNSDCDNGFCCYRRNIIPLPSRKRAQPLPSSPDGIYAKTGVCEAFVSLNASCDSYMTVFGHCGCAPGTSCQFVPMPIPTAIASRAVFMPGPGSFHCRPLPAVVTA